MQRARHPRVSRPCRSTALWLAVARVLGGSCTAPGSRLWQNTARGDCMLRRGGRPSACHLPRHGRTGRETSSLRRGQCVLTGTAPSPKHGPKDDGALSRSTRLRSIVSCETHDARLRVPSSRAGKARQQASASISATTSSPLTRTHHTQTCRSKCRTGFLFYATCAVMTNKLQKKPLQTSVCFINRNRSCY